MHRIVPKRQCDSGVHIDFIRWLHTSRLCKRCSKWINSLFNCIDRSTTTAKCKCNASKMKLNKKKTDVSKNVRYSVCIRRKKHFILAKCFRWYIEWKPTDRQTKHPLIVRICDVQKTTKEENRPKECVCRLFVRFSFSHWSQSRRWVELSRMNSSRLDTRFVF